MAIFFLFPSKQFRLIYSNSAVDPYPLPPPHRVYSLSRYFGREVQLGAANRGQKLGLVWRNRKKISQIINDYLCLPFFFLIILCLGTFQFGNTILSGTGRTKNSDTRIIPVPESDRYRTEMTNAGIPMPAGIGLSGDGCPAMHLSHSMYFVY